MPSEEISALRLTAMTYSLYSAALRFQDTARRVSTEDHRRPGTILSTDEIAAAKADFLEIMSGQFVTGQGARILETAHAALNDGSTAGHDFGRIFPGYPTLGYPTPLGWMQPERPYSYERHKVTNQDVAFIVGDCRDFTRHALSALARTKQRRLMRVPPTAPTFPRTDLITAHHAQSQPRIQHWGV
jgi:hypothetical protein